ncbi:MAG: hypothetical protein ACK4UO_06025 [Pseudolabrys sp.]
MNLTIDQTRFRLRRTEGAIVDRKRHIRAQLARGEPVEAALQMLSHYKREAADVRQVLTQAEQASV